MASNFCQICEDLQEKSEGNASPRRTINQPTCYDHVEDFKKFCEKIDIKTKIEKCRSDLTSEKTKFTDFKLDKKSIDEALKKFTPEQLYLFKEKIKTGIFNIDELEAANEQNNEEKKDDLKATSQTISSSILCQTRSPIRCPVNGCAQIVGLTSILSHFLRDHQKHQYIPSYQEIEKNQKAKLEFSHKLFNSNKVLCLGVLVYSGDGVNSTKRLTDQELCRPNSFLPEKYQKYSHHLPILILSTKTSLKYILDDPKIAENSDDINIDVYIFWSATVDVTRKIHCTLTAYDKMGINTRSTIVQIRNLKNTQNPEEFLSKESNYLLLNSGEMNLLTESETQNMYLEIQIQQYE